MLNSLLSRLKKQDWMTWLLVAAIIWMWVRPVAWVDDDVLPLPAFSTPMFDGQTVNLEQLKGQVVLVNVWATWCIWCKKEMPTIEAFYRDYRGKGFTVLALSADDDLQLAKDYVKEEGFSFPSGVFGEQAQMAFGNVSTLPSSFIVDKFGQIRHHIQGQVHYGRLEDLVNPLLQENNPPSVPQ